MTATVRSSESFSLRMIWPSFGASGDFLYPRALRHFLSDISSVPRFIMYISVFPGYFSDFNLPYCVHSWCTVFLDVDVFLALLGSCILRCQVLIALAAACFLCAICA